MKTVLAVLALVFATCLPVHAGQKNDKDLFSEKYQVFLTKAEKKELKKIKTADEFRSFEEKFWKTRDPGPDTPENEFREEIDQRLAYIASNASMDDANLPNTTFGRNGGLNGDMARVYLLHGMCLSHGPPAYKRFLRGQSFVDLLLWVYNDERGVERYRFLFYRKGNLGYFRLFRDQQYLTRQVIREELYSPDYYFRQGRQGSFDVESLLQEIWSDGGPVFLRALSGFSDDDRVTLDMALKPPTPEEIRTAYGGGPGSDSPEDSGVVKGPGDAAKLQTPAVQIRQSSSLASIPGKLEVGGKVIVFSPNTPNDLDWSVAGQTAECVLAYRLVVQNRLTREVPVALEGEQKVSVAADKLDACANDSGGICLRLWVNGLPYGLDSGNYVIYLYVRNVLTNKYAAWYIQ